MKRIAIERKQQLSPADFVRDHLHGVGKPVLVTDATDSWPARSKWTFDYLKSAYGSDFVSASLGICSEYGKTTKLGDFIDYLDKPTGDLPGFWVATKDWKPLRTPPESAGALHYLLDWNAYQRHPELFDDIKPAAYFVADWEATLSPSLREVFEWTNDREYSAIYIGPAGTFSHLHQDFGDTHACLTQIQGRKQVLLCSPGDGQVLHDQNVDPEQIDAGEAAGLDAVTSYEGVIEPGDVLFIPPNWWHCVRALDKSITVSHNFFNDCNFNQHMGGILRKLPALVDALDKSPELRAKLDVKWSRNAFLDGQS